MSIDNMILDQLDKVRSEFPECQMLALADMSSGTVLCVSTADTVPQEIVDGYLSSACEFLDGNTARHVSTALEMPEDGTLNETMVISGDQTFLFFRSPMDSKETMFCVCSAQIDIGGFLDYVRANLGAIASDQ